MKKIPWDVRKKWILGFYVVLIVGIIFSVIFFGINTNRGNVEAEAQMTQKGLLAQMSQNIDLRLSYTEQYMFSIEDRPEVTGFFAGQSGDPQRQAALNDSIRMLVESDASIDSAYFYSLNSGTVATEDGIVPIGNFYDTAWISDTQKLQERRVIWTLPRTVTTDTVPASRTSVVSLLRTYPLITTPDNIQGYVVVNVDTDMLNQIVSDTMPGTESSFMIVNRENEILFRSQNYFSYNEQQIIDALSQGGGDITFVDDAGQSMMIQHTTLEETEWKIVSVMPYSNMEGRVRAYRNYNIFIGIAVSLFMILTILLSSKWMYAPVDRFMHLVVKNAESGEGGTDKRKLRDFDELGNMFLYMMEQQKDLRQQINGSIPFIKYQLVTELISGQAMDYKQLKTQLSMIKVSLYPENYIVLLTDLDDKDILDVKTHGGDYDVYMASLYNKAEELANQESQGFSVQLPNQMCFTLLSFETDNVQSNTLRALELAEYLSNFMRECYGITITTAIGDYYRDFKDITKSYEDAVSLIKYKPIMGNNSIITIEDVQINNEANIQKVEPEIEKLLRAFESLNKEKTYALLDQVFEAMKTGQFPSDVIIQVCMRIVRSCMLVYSGQELELNNEHYQSINLSLNQLDTADEMKIFIQHILDEMLQEMSEKKRVRSSDDLIDKIVEYVDQNYAEYNMSLNLLADKFGLSIPYLSKIFKAHTQKTFTDYLIEIRIKKAAELLSNTNKKVNEISEIVGYPNPSSFIRIFKKYYFMTPIDYRNRHKFKES